MKAAVTWRSGGKSFESRFEIMQCIIARPDPNYSHEIEKSVDA
jgi:hypothetical protein